MGKWVSHGYSPPWGGERVDEIERELLREYLPVILGNFDRILEEPRHFYCQLGSAWMSTPFLGGGSIPLGLLVFLWQSAKMIFGCVNCEGDLYAVGVGGHVLSGTGSAWGICGSCRRWASVRPEQLGRSLVSVHRLLDVYRNEPVIVRGNRPTFDWAEGLKGESTPDRVIAPAVEPLPLWDLIQVLTGIKRAETLEVDVAQTAAGRAPASTGVRGFSPPDPHREATALTSGVV